MLSMQVKPLCDLCKGGVSFESSWSVEYQKAFDKELISSNSVLTHYNPKLPIYLTSDGSGYGVGVVLSHRKNIYVCLKHIITSGKKIPT